MADQPLIDLPQFENDVPKPAPRPVRATPSSTPRVAVDAPSSGAEGISRVDRWLYPGAGGRSCWRLA